MQKQVWINQGDIILLSLRDFQDDKADVIVKYTADEARSLKVHIMHFLSLQGRLTVHNRLTVNYQRTPRLTRQIHSMKKMVNVHSSLEKMERLTSMIFEREYPTSLIFTTTMMMLYTCCRCIILFFALLYSESLYFVN